VSVAAPFREDLDRFRGITAHRAELKGIASGEPVPSASALRVRGVDIARVRPIRWAWAGRLPLGYLSLLLGAEEVGKGTLIAWLVARATRGELPGDLAGEPRRVLIVGDEDAFDSVTVPRLFAAGADLALIDTLDDAEDERGLDLRQDAAGLRDIVLDRGYALVIFDALLDNLGADVDDWRSKTVRDALRPARRATRDLPVSLLGSLHPNKGTRSNFRDLVSGSHAFNALSRSSLLLAVHPDDEDGRVLVRGKGNLSRTPPSFEFDLHGRAIELNGHAFDVPLVTGAHDGDLAVEDLLKPERPAPVRESLADNLDALGTGDVQTRADLARALGREPDDRSVGRALEHLELADRWAKIGRGKWRKIGIGASSEAPMSNQANGEADGHE